MKSQNSFSLSRELLYAPVFLGALFLFAFLVPVLVALHIGGVFQGQQDIQVENESLRFPGAFLVARPGQFVAVNSSEELNPAENRDFSLVVWVRFRKFPTENGRHPFLVKYNLESTSREGYGLAINKGAEDLRLELYWKGDKEPGRWFTLSEVEFLPKEWVMLALSFYDSKTVGVNIGRLNQNGEFELGSAGGHQFAEQVFSDNPGNLLLGTIHSSEFRGKIGPLAVLQSQNIGEQLQSILKALGQSDDWGQIVPELVEKSFVITDWKAASERVTIYPNKETRKKPK